MEAITVYTVVITARYVCEAGSTAQANDRADTHWASRLDEAEHAVTETVAYKEGEGD